MKTKREKKKVNEKKVKKQECKQTVRKEIK